MKIVLPNKRALCLKLKKFTLRQRFFLVFTVMVHYNHFFYITSNSMSNLNCCKGAKLKHLNIINFKCATVQEDVLKTQLNNTKVEPTYST